MQEISPEIMPETKNKTFVVVSAILLISIAVIIAVFFNKNRSDQELLGNNDDPDQEFLVDLQENEQGDTLLFADLITNRQGSHICRIDEDQGSYIYYFDNERMAIEVILADSHTKTIIDNQFTYHWDVEEKVGTRFSNQESFFDEEIDIDDDLVDESWMEDWDEEDLLPAEDVGPFDPANFVCQVWTVDETIFAIPGDVAFQDLSEMQKQMMDFIQ